MTSFEGFSSLVLACVFVVGCRSDAPRPQTQPSVARPPPSGAVAPPLPQTTKPSGVCAGAKPCAFEWRFGSRDVRATLKGTSSDPEIEATLGGKTTEHLSLDEGVMVTRLATRDVDGDGTPDLVVWIDPAKSPPQESPRSTYLFRLTEEGFTPLPWTQAAVGVVRDDDELARALAEVRTLPTPDDNVATAVLVLRMRFATVETLRTIVGPAGLDVCEEKSGNALPHGKRCKHYPSTKITAAVLAEVLDASTPEDPKSEPDYRAVRRCAPVGVGEFCQQDTGGPQNVEFRFTGKGARRRLVEVNRDTYESS